MKCAAPRAWELSQRDSRTGGESSRWVSLVLASFATAIWAGIISLVCWIASFPVNAGWLTAILAVIFVVLLLGIGIARSGSDRHQE
jgi:hypothetical protein